jgi:hypothetical protein
MLQHRAELVDRWNKGLVEVRLPNGQAVNLLNLEVMPGKVPAPRPNFRLDSAAYDAPQGRPIEQFAGGVSSQDPSADEFARQLAAEKKGEAVRKGVDQDESELEELLHEVDKEEATEKAEDAQEGPAGEAEGEGHGEIAQVSSTDEDMVDERPVEFTGASTGLDEARPAKPPEGDVPEEAQVEKAHHKGKKGKR